MNVGVNSVRLLGISNIDRRILMMRNNGRTLLPLHKNKEIKNTYYFKKLISNIAGKGKVMKITKNSIAGTLESCDIQIMLLPNQNEGINIQLKSSVEKQFGRQIRKVIKETLENLEVDNVNIIATDKGALDCTIKARVECAAYRACGIDKEYNWEGMN